MWLDWLHYALSSTGVADALRPVLLDTTGKLSNTFLPPIPDTLLGATGTWTPTLRFGGLTTGITYSARTAYYAKLGNLVYVTMDMRLSSKGSATGTATVAGLPFTSHSSAGNHVFPWRWVQMTSTLVAASAVLGASDTVWSLAGTTAATATVGFLSDTAFANNSILQISGCYVAG